MARKEVSSRKVETKMGKSSGDGDFDFKEVIESDEEMHSGRRQGKRSRKVDKQELATPRKRSKKETKFNGNNPIQTIGTVTEGVEVDAGLRSELSPEDISNEIADSCFTELDGDAECAEEPDSSSRVPFVPQDWLDQLFQMCDRSLDVDLGKKVREYVSNVMAMTPATSSESVKAFLSNDAPQNWPSHCNEVDKLWDKYLPRMAKISGHDESSFVKPSGPLSAIVSILWHYPTWKTKMPSFGMTFDGTNPCLKLQEVKIGASDQILTMDAIPLRREMPEGGGNPFDKEDWWPKFQIEAEKLLAALVQKAKFRLVLGKENWDAFRSQLKEYHGIKYTGIDILVDNQAIDIYGSRAQFYVIQNAKTSKVIQIVLPSYHLMTFFYSTGHGAAKLCDFTWNVCAAVAGLKTVNSAYFDWKNEHGRNPSSKMGRTLRKAIELRAREKRDGPMEQAEVGKIFSPWLEKNSHLLRPEDGTRLQQITAAMARKGSATMATEAWKASEPARRQAAALSRGRATQATDEWKASEVGRRRAAAVARNAKATRATDEWKASEAAQRKLAGEVIGRRRGHVTQATAEWQASEAGQRRKQRLASATAKRVEKANRTNAAKWEALRNSEWLQDKRSSSNSKVKGIAMTFEKLDTDGTNKQRAHKLHGWQTSQRGAPPVVVFYHKTERPNGLRYAGCDDDDEVGDESEV